MNLRALKLFTHVMDEGTLTEAAAALHLSQSAASRLLSLLEAEIATALFRREKRQLVPTEAAEALYPEAVRILTQVSALPEVASGAKSGMALRVICHSRLAGGLVIPAITRFAEAFPDHAVRLETAPRRELARRVLAGRYDFAVAALPLSLGRQAAIPLARPRLDILLRKDDPLATGAPLSLSRLADMPYVALDETTAVRRTVDTALEREGVRLTPSYEMSTGTNAYRLVAAGFGFTFADAIALDPEIRGKVALVPWNREVRMELGYFRLGQGANAVTEAFAQALQQAVAETDAQGV